VHGGGHVAVLLVLAVICCGGLIGVGRRGLAAHRGAGAGKSPKAGGGWLAHRRALRLERARHENAKTRDEAKHGHRLAEQEAARQARADGGGPRGGTVRGKVVRLGDEPPPAGGTPTMPPGPVEPKPSEPPPASGQSGGKPNASAGPNAGAPIPPPAQPASPAQPQQPPARNGAAPAAATAAPGQSQSPTIEGVVMTVMPDEPGTLSVPGVEQIIEGATALRRHMMAGNAKAKRAGVLGTAAAAAALAGMVLAVSREMAEPGQHYGPEVTDPLAMIAVHFNAASLGLSEVEGRLLAIIRAAEELAARGVQAPHHDQMAVR
jgi:hypothetical protein